MLGGIGDLMMSGIGERRSSSQVKTKGKCPHCGTKPLYIYIRKNGKKTCSFCGSKIN